MSTKIYRAWGCRTNHLSAVLIDYRKECIERAAEAVRREIRKRNIAGYDSNLTSTAKQQRKQKIELAIRDIFTSSIAASHSLERCHAFDFDASLNVWVVGSYAMMIPYTELTIFPDMVPDLAHDFSYCNNTDRPADVSNATWRMRQKRWDHILANWNATRLVYTVIDAKNDTGLEDIAKQAYRFIDHTKTIPENA